MTPITSPAEALVAIIEGLPPAGVPFNGYLWEPKEIRPPAGSVGTPTLRRRAPDQAESQLATDDWYLDLLVSLYFDLEGDAQKVQADMVSALVSFTAAIDADPSLGGTVLDSGVISAVPFHEDGRNRPLIGYEITVATLSLITPDAP